MEHGRIIDSEQNGSMPSLNWIFSLLVREFNFDMFTAVPECLCFALFLCFIY
jgi:hypothetical protein